jgi:hypothetical protein
MASLTPKQDRQRYSLSLLLAGLIIIAGFPMISGGSVPGTSCAISPPSPCWTHLQTGTVAISIPPNSLEGSATINYAIPYTTTPFVAGSISSPPDESTPGLVSLDDIDLTGTNGTGFWDWKIPAATTEWLGTTTARVLIDFATLDGMQMLVWEQQACIDTCTLTLQYSTDGGSTWTDLFAAAGDMNIGSIAVNNCPTTFTVVPCEDTNPFNFINPNIANYGAIPPALLGLQVQALVRIVGGGGDGTTQAKLGGVHLVLRKTEPVILSLIVGTSLAQIGIIVMDTPEIPTTLTTVTVNWWAGIPG